MDDQFKYAVRNTRTTQANPLVITSDWNGTISDPLKGYNMDLLIFLRDAADAGHSVILTSTSSVDDLTFLLEIAIELADMQRIDLSILKDIEIMTKSDLAQRTHDGLKVDIGFDDVSIASQKFTLADRQQYAYADPQIEVTVGKGFKTFPWALDQLRERCGLAQTAGSAPPQPIPAGPRNGA